MYFDVRLCELNLTKACIHGMDNLRDQLWDRCLIETKEIWDSLPEVRDDDVVRLEGLRSIEALRDKSTVKDAGAITKATRRYSYEERLRGKLSAAIEAQLPFSWNCNWSCTDLQRRAQEICLLFDPLLNGRKSRLLPFFPVSVVAALIDCIYREGADKPSWWWNKRNLSNMIKKSLQYMKEGSERAVTEQEEEYIYIFVDLVGEAVTTLSPIFIKNKTLYHFSQGFRFLESAIITRVEGGPKGNSKPLYLTQDKIDKLLNHVSFVSPIVGAEFSMFFLAQKVVVALDDGKRLLETFCYVDDQGQGLFSIDPLMLDMVYLLRDVTSTINVALAKENQRITSHLMTVLAEPQKGAKRISFSKLFMIATVLMKGFNAQHVDLTDINEGILSKMGNNGLFAVKRKPWKKLASGERKRGPKFQPEAVVIDDENGDTMTTDTKPTTIKKGTKEGASKKKDELRKKTSSTHKREKVAIEKEEGKHVEPTTKRGEETHPADTAGNGDTAGNADAAGKEDEELTAEKGNEKKGVTKLEKKRKTKKKDVGPGSTGELKEMVEKYYPLQGSSTKGGDDHILADVFGSDESETNSDKKRKSPSVSPEKKKRPAKRSARTQTRNMRKRRKRW